MKRSILILLLLILLLSACSGEPEATLTPSPVPATAELPDPVAYTTEVPDADLTAEAFLTAWKNENYIDMYNMLSQVSRDAISYEDFSSRYISTTVTMTLDTLDYSISSSLTNPGNAQIAYHITFNTKSAGTFSRDMQMNMVLDAGSWKIQWEDGMIMPELSGGNKLVMDLTVPSRGPIYDINGVPLASEVNAYAIGVIPAQIGENRWGALVNELSRLTGKTTQIIQQLLKETSENTNDYVIIGEVPADVLEERYSIISQYTGVALNPYSATRFYYEGGVAPHVVGYVQPIGAEEADQLVRQGYRIDEKIGRLGIEMWGQDQLDGERGASLYVVDPDGNSLSRISNTAPLAANSIYTTFNEDFQYDLQRSIAGFNAAVVVLERDTGRVLGMASAPTFDPNLLDYNNYNNYFSGDLLYNNNRPMYNRASQGQYPLGSVFKLISMAAALENNVYKITDTMECGYEFTELDGVVLTDWTLEKEIPASGVLNLSEAIMRSCNPWFYKIGLELYRQAGPESLAEMARGFGLGSLTGIGEIEEEPGNIEVPPDEYSSVQMGIGQGTILVTPLQVARFIAAIGNGGTLYRPQVVEQIVDPTGKVVYAFEPEEQGKLPVSAENLQLIQEAMLSVTDNVRGTAHNTFNYTRQKVYGKTGTAQTSPGYDPHAWFAGYTNEQDPEKPDIAIAVLVEYIGDGSEYAAPIFRRVLELYYNGRATTPYNWEAGVYITRTPTPTPTNTPTPKPTRAPWDPTIDPNMTETPAP